MTPAGGAGRFPRVGARHLRSRAASARYVRPASRPVCELELAGLGQEGAGNAREKGARSFEPSGSRAPTVSREARKLKLSGGVRSLPRAPWWNADRRARPQGRVPRPFFCPPPQAGEDEGGGAEVVEQRLSAFRFPVRHCERSEAIQSHCRGLWIASSPQPIEDERERPLASQRRGLSARDLDGGRSHHRRHLTKIGSAVVCLLGAGKTRAHRRRENGILLRGFARRFESCPRGATSRRTTGTSPNGGRRWKTGR